MPPLPLAKSLGQRIASKLKINMYCNYSLVYNEQGRAQSHPHTLLAVKFGSKMLFEFIIIKYLYFQSEDSIINHI